MATHNQLGSKGEEIGIKYLQEKGFEILDENWVYDHAELDIIAFQNNKIIFVEVKTRTSDYFGKPEEFVDLKKEKLLEKAAAEYVRLMEFEGEIRFDIISIVFAKNGTYDLRHIEDAFFPGWG